MFISKLPIDRVDGWITLVCLVVIYILSAIEDAKHA